MPEKFVVQLSSQAKKDLKEITSYLYFWQDWYDNFLSADKTINSIRQKIRSLAIFPEGYSLVELPYKTKYQYRRVHVKHCNIYFIVDSEHKKVIVTSIVDARQNPKKTQTRLS
ncbi:type II toxin-antitoxin system RelE/ParE family toxin [Candidatus Saccharibacteria bacterium]|nr:type II toxin-antitoxin system RelE/ParE family toxin [Candidatus Saccharibacteria bacterium]